MSSYKDELRVRDAKERAFISRVLGKLPNFDPSWDVPTQNQWFAWLGVLSNVVSRLTGSSKVIFAEAMAKNLNAELDNITAEQRLKVLEVTFDGYCKYCGAERSGVCHCQNDE